MIAMKKQHLLLCLFLLFPSFYAVAQDPLPLSLDDAVKYALQHNISIKNAALDIKIQKAKNAEITGIALPQINGKDEFTSYPNQVQSFVPAQFIGGPAGTFVAVPFTPKFGNTVSLQGSQIVFDGTIIVALQAKKTIIKLTELSAKSTAQDVRYNVQRTYYSLVVLEKQLQLLNTNMVTIREILNDQIALNKAGFIEKIEVDRGRVQLNNLISDSLSTANSVATVAQLLKYNMGMNISNPILLTDTALRANLDQAQAALLNDIEYGNRIEYQLLETQIRLNEYDVKRYKYKALPTLAAFGSAAYTYSANTFNEVASASNYVFYSVAGATLNVPIFTGFQRTNQLKQAKFTLEKTRNNLDNLKLSIDLQTQQARITLRNSLLALENQNRNLELANTVLDLSNKKYKAGVGSSLEINQAQTDLVATQNNYFQSMLNVINAQTDLQRALGLFR